MGSMSGGSDALFLIVRSFLESDSGLLSGQWLADSLGVSRAAIRGRIEQLLRLGYRIEARRGLGYQFLSEPEFACPYAIRGRLADIGDRFELVVIDETDSTNSEAERLLAVGRETPFALIARCQSGGRGRMGRRWESALTGGLYLSLVLEPRLPPSRLQLLTLWMGCRLCEVIGETHLIPVGIKWPNDLQVGGRKVAGMLAEARIDSDLMHHLIFGLGLNINTPMEEFPEVLRGSASSLSVALGRKLPFNGVVALAIRALLTAYSEVVAGLDQACFHSLWNRYSVLNGKQVVAKSWGGSLEGRMVGVAADGALLLDTGSAEPQALYSADVTLSTPA